MWSSSINLYIDAIMQIVMEPKNAPTHNHWIKYFGSLIDANIKGNIINIPTPIPQRNEMDKNLQYSIV